MMHVNQIVMLYTLNLHSAACQLYLTKTERKKIFLNRELCSPLQRNWHYLEQSVGKFMPESAVQNNGDLDGEQLKGG